MSTTTTTMNRELAEPALPPEQPEVAWVVELTYHSDVNLDEDRYTTMDAEGDSRDWYVSSRHDGPGLVVTAYTSATGPIAAAQTAEPRVGKWLVGWGVDADLVALCVVSEWQRQREVAEPNIPQMVSAHDVAEILGVSRRRVHQLAAQHPLFPSPVTTVASGSLWTLDAVQHFARVWDRRPGRRRATSSTGTAPADPGRGGER